MSILPNVKIEEFNPTASDPKVITEDDMIRVAMKFTTKWYPSLSKVASISKDTFSEDDLFQDLFMNLREKRGQYDPAKATKSTFLYNFTNQKCFNIISRLRNGKNGNARKSEGTSLLSLDYEYGNGDAEETITLADFIPDRNPTPDAICRDTDRNERVMAAFNKGLEKIKPEYREHVKEYVMKKMNEEWRDKADTNKKFMRKFKVSRQTILNHVNTVMGEAKQILKKKCVSL